MVEMLPTAVLLLLVAGAVARDNSTCDGPCGLRFRHNLQGAGRVVGGQATVQGAWPWMVSLQIFTAHDKRRYHACGGSLLNSHWLLTAAHCFRIKKNVYEWRLILGAREIEYGSNKPVRPPLQERYIEKIIIHEHYNPVLEENDIALLKITPPVVCGHLVGPGCLPHFRAGPPRVPQTCWVVGWGFLKEDDERPSPVLQEARVELIHLDQCNSTQWYHGEVFSTNVCAGYPEGKIDTCQGDSGGPLMCRDSRENAYVIVGITSWGVGCARAKRPGVYTATWPYVNWIASKMGSHAMPMLQLGTTPPPPSPPPPPSTKVTTTHLPVHPPWYFQSPPQPPPLHPPTPLPWTPAPPSAPPSTKPPQESAFVQRLQQLMETLRRNPLVNEEGSDETQGSDLRDLSTTSSSDPFFHRAQEHLTPDGSKS